MTSAITGLTGWAIQSAKGTKAAVAATKWHKVLTCGLGVLNMEDVFDPEVGGQAFPGGAYRGGYAVGGDVSMYPRLGGYFPYLLAAVAGTEESPSASGSAYAHTFLPLSTDELDLPYLTFRRLVPGTTQLKEAFVDCRVAAMTLNFAPAAPMTVEATVLGLSSVPETDTYTPSWSSGGEDVQTSVPVGCVGSFKLNDGVTTYKPLGVQVQIVNNPYPDNEERPLFQYTREDVSLASREVSIIWTFAWKNKTLYDQLYYGDSSWTPVVWQGSEAFEVIAKSAGNISGASQPYLISFQAAKVMWSMEPVRLMGNRNILMRIVGRVLDNTDDSLLDGDSFKIIVINDASAAYYTP